MSGHTKWSELRDQTYAERPGMAERVAALRSRDTAETDENERWEIELEAEALGDPPSKESLREQLAQAVGDSAKVLDVDVEVRTVNGKAFLLVVLVVGVAIGAAVAAKRFAQADQTAQVLRLHLGNYGPIVAQSVRRAA